MTKERIGSILKELRLTSGKTQKEVAEALGRTQQIVGHWETGYSQPDANTLFTLCGIYGTSIDEAFGFKKEDISITKNDITMLEAFHSLDTYGQETINMVLEREAKRIRDIETLLHKKDERIAELESKPTNIIEFNHHTGNSIPERFISAYYSTSAGTGIFIMGNEVVDKIPIPDTLENRNVDYAIKVSGDSMEPEFHDGDTALVSQKSELSHGDIGIFIVNGNAYIKEYGEKELISHNPDSDNINISEYDNIVCMGRVVGKL